MELTRNGTRPSAKGPSEYFTGTVRIDPLFKAPEPSRSSGAYVTFEPCARSHWHTHPLGQTLIVTSGCGFVQSWGGPIQVIRPGDVVWCPPGEKHWHGAAPDTAMTHLAIQEELHGRVVDWLEKVTDEQYRDRHDEPEHIVAVRNGGERILAVRSPVMCLLRCGSIDGRLDDHGRTSTGRSIRHRGRRPISI